MILADTSVWIDHLRRGDPALARELDAGSVLMHPIVIGEIACGTLRRRSEILGLLRQMQPAPVATDDEALAFIERRSLAGRGIGYADVQLLASVALGADLRLWTRDRHLAKVADALGVAYDERAGG